MTIVYRTKTYIAADWDGDQNAIEQLKTWNNSFIEYECKKAVRDGLQIVVLYNAATVDKDKCPDAIKAYGTHAPMQKMKDGKHYWDYQSVKTSLGL